MGRHSLKVGSVLISLLVALGGMAAFAPSAVAAETCTLWANQVHSSGHVSGRMNATVKVACNYDPPGYLYLDGDVQVYANGTWRTQSGWATTIIADKATWVEKSLSRSCAGNSTSTLYRSRARFGIGPSRVTAKWSGWAASSARTVNCGGGGGGGGGSWSDPTTGSAT